jgi:hypothetical protein
MVNSLQPIRHQFYESEGLNVYTSCKIDVELLGARLSGNGVSWQAQVNSSDPASTAYGSWLEQMEECSGMVCAWVRE